MNVTSAAMIHPNVVEVLATGPRGGRAEFAVTIHRSRRVAGAYRHTPSPGYLVASEVPDEVGRAALQAYHDANPL